jgi:hypothetical protein
MPTTCSSCGSPGSDRRVLFPVVDELGRSAMCGLCLISLLSRVRSSADVTVFVARPAAVAS